MKRKLSLLLLFFCLVMFLPYKPVEAHITDMNLQYEIDYEKGQIVVTWEAWPGANRYDLLLMRQDKDDPNKFKSGSYSVEYTPTNLYICRIPYSKITNSPVEGTNVWKLVCFAYSGSELLTFGETETFEGALSTPVLKPYKDGVVSWNPVNGASSYRVRVYTSDSNTSDTETFIGEEECDKDVTSFDLYKYFDSKYGERYFKCYVSAIDKSGKRDDSEKADTGWIKKSIVIAKQPEDIYMDTYYDDFVNFSVEAYGVEKISWLYRDEDELSGDWCYVDNNVSSQNFTYTGIGGRLNKYDYSREFKCVLTGNGEVVNSRIFKLKPYKDLMKDYDRKITLAPMYAGDLIDFTGEKIFSSDTYRLDPEYNIVYSKLNPDGTRYYDENGKAVWLEPGDKFDYGYKYEIGLNIILPEDVYGEHEIYGFYNENGQYVIINDEPTVPDSVNYSPYGGTVFYITPIIDEREHSNKTTTTKATLSTNGKKETKCTICGKTISTSYIYKPDKYTLSATSYTYDGKAHKPTVKSVVDSNGKTIAATNYTVSYVDSNNNAVTAPTNAGTYKVKIVFKGNDYTGTKYVNYTIKPSTKLDVDLTDCASLYTGKAAYTSAKVYDVNNKLLKEKVDYSLEYYDYTGTKKVTPIKVGKYIVKITMKGNYSGVFKPKYEIFADETKLSTPVIASDGITLKWTKVNQATGYYIYRGVNGSNYSMVKNITNNSTLSWKDTATKVNGYSYDYYILTYTSVDGYKVNGGETVDKTVYYLSRPTVTLTNTASGVKVAWGKNSKATGYYIYRSTDGGKTYSKIKTITSYATVNYTDTAAKTNGTKYMYKVEAYKTVSGKTYKSAVSAVKSIYFVSKPTISSLTNTTGLKMLVKWAKNAKATGYLIQYSTSSSFSSPKNVTATGTSTTISKTIGSLTKGKTYYVRLRSYKTVGSTKYYSAWSATKTIKITK